MMTVDRTSVCELWALDKKTWISLLSVIVRVSIVLKRTVVVDND